MPAASAWVELGTVVAVCVNLALGLVIVALKAIVTH